MRFSIVMLVYQRVSPTKTIVKLGWLAPTERKDERGHNPGVTFLQVSSSVSTRGITSQGKSSKNTERVSFDTGSLDQDSWRWSWIYGFIRCEKKQQTLGIPWDILEYLGISRSRHIWGWAYSGISWKIWCFQTIPDINCPTISGIYWDILDIGIFVQAYDSNRLKPSWVLNGLVPAMPKIFDPPFCCSIQPAKWSCDVVCFTLW